MMRKKIVTLFLLTAFLTGCMPAAFLVGATAGGAVIYDNRSVKTMVQDRDIAHQAAVKIYNNKMLRHKTHIVVTSFNRVVLMVGQAPTPELKRQVYQLVRSVPNIRRIFNEVSVAAPTSETQRADDTWITTKVKTKMLTKRGLHSTQMKVLTENGVVYLMGLVSPSQGDMAANLARRVSGVKKVVKLFEYVH